MIKRTCRLYAIAAVAMAISSAAAAQTAPPVTSEKAQAIFQAWQGLMSAQQSLLSSLPPTTTLADEFGRRKALRSLGNDAHRSISSSDISTEDRARLNQLIWEDTARLTSGDLDHLKSVIPADGWFRRSRDGVEVSNYAIDLMHYTNDLEFRAQALKAMESLVELGEIDAARYAAFFDSNERRAGRLQRYGTLSECVDGRMSILPVADPNTVDELRRSVGLPDTYAVYGALVNGRRC